MRLILACIVFAFISSAFSNWMLYDAFRDVAFIILAYLLVQANKEIRDKLKASMLLMFFVWGFLHNLAIELLNSIIVISALSVAMSVLITYFWSFWADKKYRQLVKRRKPRKNKWYEIVTAESKWGFLAYASGLLGSRSITDGVHVWEYKHEQGCLIKTDAPKTAYVLEIDCNDPEASRANLNDMVGAKWTFLSNCFGLRKLIK